MQIVNVSGSALDMGRAQGASTFESWWKMLDMVRDLRVPRGLEDLLAEHCPRQLVRMIGLSRGTGIELETVLSMCVLDLFLSQVDYYVGCTSFALRGESSPGGGVTVCKNFDHLTDLAEANIIRVSRPDHGLSSMEITAGPLSGSHAGVNEKGLAIAYNFAPSIDKSGAPLPLTILVQHALETLDTTEATIEFFEGVPRGGSGMLLIADGSGDVAGLEVSPHYTGVRRPDGDFIGQTNHFQTPPLVAVGVPRDAFYSDRMPEALQGERVGESSEKRYARMMRLLKSMKLGDMAVVKGILSDHGDQNAPSDNTICRHGPHFDTTVSIIMNSAGPSMDVADGYPCSGDYRRVEL